MNWWRERVLPRLMDNFLDVEHIHELRSRACQGLFGHVLEIGFGSGLNIYHYPDKVRAVSAVEPSDLAWQLAQRRIYPTHRDVQRVALNSERLDLPSDTFDSALSTYTMCTVPDLEAALAEVSRVLKPAATLHFLEHGRSPDPGVATWQHRLQPLYHAVAGGCHLDRPIAAYIERSPLVLKDLETFYDDGPKPFTSMYLGTATKPA
jgi:ubiquinone/menaquinone biosynthesis C-methylase UbiE